MVAKWRQRFSVSVTSRGYHDNGHVLLIEETYYFCIPCIFRTGPITSIIILIWSQLERRQDSFRNTSQRKNKRRLLATAVFYATERTNQRLWIGLSLWRLAHVLSSVQRHQSGGTATRDTVINVEHIHSARVQVNPVRNANPKSHCLCGHFLSHVLTTKIIQQQLLNRFSLHSLWRCFPFFVVSANRWVWQYQLRTL
jgi:hypothetical protein